MFQNDLPNEWVLTAIESVAEVKGGKRLPKGKKLLDEITPFPYLRVTDFNNGSINTNDLKYIDPETQNAIKNYTILSDDLYISIAGTIGLVGEIPEFLSGANLTENAAKLCGLVGVNKVFLRYVLNSNGAIEQFQDKTTSSGQPKLALFRIKDCLFPFAPLAEQKVIADKLDSLLAQVETTKARLDRVPYILKRFRQSVLAGAVSGRLTEEWRAKPASTESSMLKLESLLVSLDQGWSPKCINESVVGSDWGVIKTSAIQSGFFVNHENKKLPDSLVAKENLSIAKGDVLITRAGPRVRCGVTCIVEEDYKNLMICDKVYRLRVNHELILPPYLNFCLNSPHYLKDIEMLKTGSSENGMNMTQKKLKELVLQVPSLEEQSEIVRRVEELFAFADAVEQKAQAATERVNKLTQSILAKAFRGELTADWRATNPDLISGENSAEALLEKIKAEREALKPKKKTLAKKVKI